MSTLYSWSPMRAVPAGTMTLDACSALTTSFGERPWPPSAWRIDVDVDLPLLAAEGRRRGRGRGW